MADSTTDKGSVPKIEHGDGPALAILRTQIASLQSSVTATEQWAEYLPLFASYVRSKFDELYRVGWRPAEDRWVEGFLVGIIEPILATGVIGDIQVGRLRCLWNDLVPTPCTTAMAWPNQKREAARILGNALKSKATVPDVTTSSIDAATSVGTAEKTSKHKVDDFLRRVALLRPSVNYTSFWRVAGYHDDSLFGKWRRASPDASKRSIKRFESILALSPTAFLERLDGLSGSK